MCFPLPASGSSHILTLGYNESQQLPSASDWPGCGVCAVFKTKGYPASEPGAVVMSVGGRNSSLFWSLTLEYLNFIPLYKPVCLRLCFKVAQCLATQDILCKLPCMLRQGPTQIETTWGVVGALRFCLGFMDREVNSGAGCGRRDKHWCQLLWVLGS